MVAAGNPNAESSGKKDRREAAREKARLDREIEKRRARRNRGFIQGGIGVAVLVIVAIVAIVIVNQPPPPSSVGPKNMLSDGILFSGPNNDAVTTAAIPANGKPVATSASTTAGMANIVVYLDYSCPYCAQFESTNSAQIAALVKKGTATLEIHPIAFLDNSSGTNKYSTRAANAIACVANYEPNSFLAVSDALYRNQPAENAGGKSDAQLLSVLSGAGAGSAEIRSCVTSGKFGTWVAAATNRLDLSGKSGSFAGVAKTPEPFAGTPTIFVNGIKYPGSITSAPAFAAFVAAQQAAS